MDDFELELKNDFLEEASKLLDDSEQCFLNLESNMNDKTLYEEIFRLAHNLKGSAKAVGFDDLGHLTHQLESLLLKLKNGDIQPNTAIITLLLECNDQLKAVIALLKMDYNAKCDSSSLLDRIQVLLDGGSLQIEEVQAPAEVASVEAPAEESFGFVTEEEVRFMQSAMNKFEEEVTPAPVAAVEVEEVHSNVTPITAAVAEIQAEVAAVKAAAPAGNTADESIRVSLSRLEKLLNFVGELVILQTVLKGQATNAGQLALRRTVDQLGKVTKEVQDISMSLRMVPLKQTFQKMQRIVRDTSQQLNKKIDLVLVGAETEVDKTVLEKIGDPLVHLIRNAADHGIEDTEARVMNGKDETGKVILSAYHQSGSLVIEIKDDGKGLDPKKLLEKAKAKGIVKPNQVLSDKEAQELIFSSGFSTKEVVSDISGRGVGMDVVRQNIQALQGDISIESVVGQGTTFKIRLPLTLAITDGMIVKVGEDKFILPLNHVHETYRPEAEDIKITTNLGAVLLLRGENMPVYDLAQCIGRSHSYKKITDSICIIVRTMDKPFAILIDDIIGQHQVVIKKLGPEYAHIKGFSGSAILEDGKPAIILELGDLIKSKAHLKISEQTITVSSIETRRTA